MDVDVGEEQKQWRAGQRDEGGDSERRESALQSVLSCAVLRLVSCLLHCVALAAQDLATVGR